MTDVIDVLYVDAGRDAEATADALEGAHDRLAMVAAGSDAGALDLLADEPVDCVACVHRPPAIDGLELLDAARDERPGLPVVLLVDEADAPVAEEALCRGASDCLRARSDGPRIPLLAARIVNAAGGVAAERELPEVDRRARALLAVPGEYAQVIDPDGVVEYVTPSVERVLGREPAVLVDRGAFECVHPDDRAGALAQFEEVVDDPAAERTVEVRARYDDGSPRRAGVEWRWLEIEMRNRLADPAVEGIVAGVSDVTERKETAADAEWHRAVIRNMDEGIYVTDADYVLRFVDARTEALDDREEVWTGRPLSYLAEGGVLSETEVASIETSIDELLADNADEVRIEIEPSVPASTGTVELRLTPMCGTDGERLVLGTTRDITERKRREEELERQNERLDEFASIVSHDLRSPLNVADGRIRLASEECDSDHLPVAMDALGRMDEIIEGTLTLARQGDRVGDPEPIALREFSVECWERVSTADASVEVADDAVIHADPEQLAHVFENLFRNAVEHGTAEDRPEAEGGQANGSTGRRPGADDLQTIEYGSVTVTVGTTADGEGIYVADDGRGIPDEERERVFESGYCSSPDGTGFGLAIVREIVDAHGWDVRATESAEGGARFEITGVRIERD